MHGGLLIKYASWSTAPTIRVASFVDNEPRLTWTSLFLQEFPNAEIFLVGGSLRDLLIGKIPNDIDIVIRNVTEKTLERWLTSQGAVKFIESKFGTFKFVAHGCRELAPIDIALPRSEIVGNDHKSRRTDMVIQSDFRLTIQEDLSRRDFTINALAYNIDTKEIIDPFNGILDIQNNLIRCVESPEKRFYEDATRVLRGLRFASQLNFGIEAETWEAIKNNIDILNNKIISDDGTYKYLVPRDAIGKEFLLGFIAHPVHTLNVWHECGALEKFLPDIYELKNLVEHSGKTALEHTKQALHLLKNQIITHQHEIESVDATTLIAGLGLFLDKGNNLFKICRDYYLHQFPENHDARVDCTEVKWLLDNLHILDEQDPAAMRPSTFEHQFCNERGKKLLLLIHIYYQVLQKHCAGRERIHTAMRISNRFTNAYYPKLIRGKDIAELGIEPGPKYREMMNKVRDAQLVDRIHTTEEAVELIKAEI